MKCIKCGWQISQKLSNCPNCGAPITGQAVTKFTHDVLSGLLGGAPVKSTRELGREWLDKHSSTDYDNEPTGTVQYSAEELKEIEYYKKFETVSKDDMKIVVDAIHEHYICEEEIDDSIISILNSYGFTEYDVKKLADTVYRAMEENGAFEEDEIPEWMILDYNSEAEYLAALDSKKEAVYNRNDTKEPQNNISLEEHSFVEDDTATSLSEKRGSGLLKYMLLFIAVLSGLYFIIPLLKPKEKSASSPAVTSEKTSLTMYSVINVKSNDVLNLRLEPNYRTKKTGEIPYDATGIRGLEDTVINGKKWIRVEFRKSSGWANAYYLTKSIAETNSDPLKDTVTPKIDTVNAKADTVKESIIEEKELDNSEVNNESGTGVSTAEVVKHRTNVAIQRGKYNSTLDSLKTALAGIDDLDLRRSQKRKMRKDIEKQIEILLSKIDSLKNHL